MRSRVRTRVLLGLVVLVGTLAFSVGSASAQTAFHGIAFVKGCDSPTQVGSPYNCAYTILNVVDTAHDTLQINGVTDQVHAATGDVNSGNILPALQLIFSGPTVVCVGGSGAGQLQAEPAEREAGGQEGTTGQGLIDHAGLSSREGRGGFRRARTACPDGAA